MEAVEAAITGKPIDLVIGVLVTTLATGAMHMSGGDEKAFDLFCNTVIEGLRATRDHLRSLGETKQ